MEIECQTFHGKTIATNNTYPRGVSGAKFIKGGVRVSFRPIPEWLFQRLFYSNTLDLKYRLRLKGRARDGSHSEPREVEFSLLSGTNPRPVGLITTEKGLGVSTVEFMINKIANATKSGFTTYMHFDFYWSAELWNGDEMLDIVDSTVNFKLVAVSNGANNMDPTSGPRRPPLKRRKVEKLVAIKASKKKTDSTRGLTSHSSPAALFPKINMKEICVLLNVTEMHESSRHESLHDWVDA